jgi:hypothetical protein
VIAPTIAQRPRRGKLPGGEHRPQCRPAPPVGPGRRVRPGQPQQVERDEVRQPFIRGPGGRSAPALKPVLQPLEREPVVLPTHTTSSPSSAVASGRCTAAAAMSRNAGATSVPRRERSITRPASVDQGAEAVPLRFARPPRPQIGYRHGRGEHRLWQRPGHAGSLPPGGAQRPAAERGEDLPSAWCGLWLASPQPTRVWSPCPRLVVAQSRRTDCASGAHGLRNAVTCRGRVCGRGTAVRSDPAARHDTVPPARGGKGGGRCGRRRRVSFITGRASGCGELLRRPESGDRHPEPGQASARTHFAAPVPPSPGSSVQVGSIGGVMWQYPLACRR